ncbi:TetR family transcriptional regulator [Bacillus sp. AFS017336]|nr:TetR family transcriptional regulator [Bacillus sp. AFS017336]
MIIYYLLMRLRDENKTEAIFNATIQLVNAIGFSEISISKIAKKANVSAATIYIYFENKEDMLKECYLKSKRLMSDSVIKGVDNTGSTRQQFENYTRNFVEFIMKNSDYFLFIEQVSNSPLLQNWCLDESSNLFTPVFDMFENGKKQLLIKQEDINLLIMYSMLPISQLAKSHIKGQFNLDESTLNKAIQMSWDAIKA